MPRYELTIKATYLPGWHVWEGVREIIQNSRDAEIQYSAPMTVKYAERQRDGKKGIGAVVITNEGVVLPKEALLIGHTTKEGDSRLIGKFGEGLKYSCLALLRLGIEVKIKNGSEVWVPAIEHSDKFNSDVLVFNVTTGHKFENRVSFEVVGIEKSDWEDIKNKLLFIGEYPEHIKTYDGKILTSPLYKGMIFVKGMFVARTNTTLGYDFDDADIDRDRRMVNSLNEKTSILLSDAVNDGKLTSQVYCLMQEGAEEASYINSWRLNAEAREAIANEFRTDNPGVIPVERLEQVQELELFGKRGRQVGWSLRTILESVMGTAATHIQDLRKSDKYTYDLNDLESSERDNLRMAVATVGRACQKLGDVVIGLDKVLVVDFHKDILGTYEPNAGVVRLARKILKNKGQTLYTMIHEVAHAHGGHGMFTHEEAIGKISETIFNDILG